MTPSNYALTLYRGDSYRWQFRLWSDTAKTQPVDLTNVVTKAEIRTRPGGKLLVALASSVALPNKIDVVLSAAASAALPADGGYWDMQLNYSGGDVLTVISGHVWVGSDVTGSYAA
jgi:hypothetical protein